MNTLYIITPAAIDTAKNNTVLIITEPGSDEGSFIPITNVSTMIPITSSIMAALIIVVPVSVFRYPSSCSEATVILTEVAVIITPMNTAE